MANPVSVEFHFDFGSPNAYLSHRVIPAIEARTGTPFRYVPVLLGGVFKATGNKSPMEMYGGIKNKPEFLRRETERFLKRHKITNYVRNPHFPVNTLLIMRGAVVAEAEARLADYVDAVFRCMWEQGLKMDDPAVAADALTAAGFDGPALLARTQEPEMKARLVANTEASVARGTFGSPTFFVGEEMFFGKDQLRDVEEAILAAKG
ncbi:MAG: 2-hydroxychromene-2-carboxylate isomerase [Alphaproteobacteria bacterium]|nr:2-hydroxychromene-2-carboxylate isomerase [Alphaproteobacteria bacterium]MCB9930654.1 2-hydroxychromene-2-carboxylate isomerase [Alphaproteobacteria bacterium]